jgi:hypothetical protein
LVHVFGNDSVSKRLGERPKIFWGLGFHQIEKAWSIFRRLYLAHICGTEFLQDHERSPSNIVLAEIFNTRLSLFDLVDNHVVESSSASRRNGDIVFIGNRTKVSKSPLTKKLVGILKMTMFSYMKSFNFSGLLETGERI